MIRKTLTMLAVLGAAIAFGAAPAAAAEMIDSYNAWLSRADHFNSSGARLTTAAAIIRQDRANFHKFGIRDPGDDDDSYFGSVDNRAVLERMLNDGTSDPDVLERIVSGPVRIHVEVYRSRHGDYVVVTLASSEGY